ncbi:hypothetical protein JCM8097_003043 [Rhodosporidiobolus ruineniae]
MPLGGPPPLRRLDTSGLSSSSLPPLNSNGAAQGHRPGDPARRTSSPAFPHAGPAAQHHPANSLDRTSSTSGVAGQAHQEAYCTSPVTFHDHGHAHAFSLSASNGNGIGASSSPPRTTTTLKSRRDTMSTAAGSSPTQTHASLVARRRDTGGASPIASASGGGTGGGGGGYIGGGFAGTNGSGKGRRNSFSAGAAQKRRWWTSRGRTTKLVILLLGGLAVWYVVKGWRAEEKPRQKLMHRWWEAEETPADDLAALLPRPTLPPRPPRPKPPPSVPSHTLSQLLKLPSTVSFTSASLSPDWTALVHLTSSSQLLPDHLQPLLSSLARQSVSPSKILLLVPSGLEPSHSTVSFLGPLVSTASYPPQEAPILALVHAACAQVASDYILFVDGNLPTPGTRGSDDAAEAALSKDYVRTLLYASGTKEYSAAVLTAGGLSLPPSSPSVAGATCTYPSLLSSPSSAVTTPITLPTLPFLLSTSWLLPTTPGKPSTSILQGLNTALPLEIALSAALWTKHALPVFALPVPFSSAAASQVNPQQPGTASAVDGWTCERLRRSLAADPRVGELFHPTVGGGEGIRRLQASGDRAKGGLSPSSAAAAGKGEWSSAADEADEQRSRLLQQGTVVILLSGREELDAARALACRFAASGIPGGGAAEGGPRTDFKVVLADYELAEAERDEARRTGSAGVGAGAGTCHLELTPLGSSSSSSGGSSSSSTSTSEPISLALVDLLDALTPSPAFVLYLTDGPRAREFEEVLRWMGGVFGPRKGGSAERWGRVRAEKELLKGMLPSYGGSKDGGEQQRGRGRATVVGMRREEVKRAEWVGALEVEALRHWHTPRIDLSVVTNDRPVSLHRLLTSLQTAYYYGDDVSLAVNLEQTTDRLTHRLVDDLRWPHGTFNLRHRILLGGLMPAIVESWYPTSNDTYGVLLEDDVEVSPLFYGWLKLTILQYRYTLAGRRASRRLFGVSLYQQKNIELRPEGRQPFDAHRLFTDLSLHPTSPYLSQIPCSWGAAYFPEVWREFHTYLSLRLSELALPISEPLVPAIRSNRWPRSWKKYFIELVYLRGYAMLYPNYPDFESLSTNHLEKGTHVHTSQVEEKKKALFEVPLLGPDASLVDSLPGGPGRERLPEYPSLPVMDLWGALACPAELLERGWQTTRMLGACKALPDLTAPPRFDARELLCRRVWDRETEGRLVDAQPLRAPGEEAARPADAAAAPPGERDQGRAAAAEEEVRDDQPAPGGGLGAEPRNGGGAVERAFYPAPVAGADVDAAEEDDHRPARPQHDHLHEDASIHEGELDDADLGKRGALFDEDEGAHGQQRRKWRKAVDLEARTQHEEESEYGLDEDEQEGGEAEEPLPTVEAFNAPDAVEGEEEEPVEVEEEERKVRWARAD